MMTSNFTIDVQVHKQRVRYTEPGRSTSIRLESDSRDAWWLWPDTLTWWDRANAGRSDASYAMREPMSDSDRETILERIVAELRQRHGLWVNIAGRAIEPKPRNWGPPPVRSDIDPELAFMLEDFDAAPPESPRVYTEDEDAALLGAIETVLVIVQPMDKAGWPQAASITRQLCWCRSRLRGERVEPAPGPLSMGLIATREFDMYGTDPDLARLINDIQREMRRRGLT